MEVCIPFQEIMTDRPTDRLAHKEVTHTIIYLKTSSEDKLLEAAGVPDEHTLDLMM